MLKFNLTFTYKGHQAIMHVSKIEVLNGTASYFVEVEEHQKFNVPDSIILQQDYYGGLVFYYEFSDKKFVTEIARHIILYCQENNILL